MWCTKITQDVFSKQKDIVILNKKLACLGSYPVTQLFYSNHIDTFYLYPDSDCQ